MLKNFTPFFIQKKGDKDLSDSSPPCPRQIATASHAATRD